MQKLRIIICVFVLFGAFGIAQAKDIRQVRFTLASPEKINSECQVKENHSLVTSCYLGLTSPQIIIRSDISPALLPYALITQVGYYFLDGASTDILKTLFGPGISSIKDPTDKDYFNRAAGDFALWVMGSNVGTAKTNFFLLRMSR